MKPLILGPCNMRVVARELEVPPRQMECLPDGGGINITNLAIALIRKGIRFDLGTLSPGASTDIESIPAGPVTLWVARSRRSRRLRDAYREERQNLRGIIARSDCTVVNANWTYEYGLAAVGSSKPCLVTVQDCASEILRLDSWRYLPHYLMARHVIRRARSLASVSPYVQEYLRRVWRRESEIVPNVLPPELPERAAERAGAPILIVGHGGRHKNVRTAIAGFGQWRAASISGSHVRLRMVGRGLGPSEPVQRWAAARGLEQGLEFVGERSPDEVLREIASARFLLSASLSESWSLAVAEAMAIGVPVLAAQEAGGVRFLLGSDGGWFMSGRSAASVAEGIGLLLGAPAEARTRAARAQERIRVLSSANTVIEALQRALAAAADPSHGELPPGRDSGGGPR